MMRLAAYARYSTDLQSDRSVDDQFALCGRHAERIGGTIVETFADHAISGSHAGSRPGLQRMLAACRAQRFDGVIVEALDRLSRDQEDTAAIYKRMTFAGVKIITVADGEVNEMHVGMKGMMAAMFVKDLAAKVRRGQEGRVRDGLHGGGLAYGYRVLRKFDAKGEPERGHREIDAEQAAVVRRIFREYAMGKSPIGIATGLNRDGIPSPRGGTWAASAISGNAGRGNGILWNEAYVGFLVWNRIRMVRDPDSGRRVSRPNPHKEWVVVEAPQLRIVDQELWDAAQAARRRYTAPQAIRVRRPKRILSGLVYCGACGGPCTVLSSTHFGCANARSRGTCENRSCMSPRKLESRVLRGLMRDLLQPDVVDEFVREYRRLERAHAGTQKREREEAAGELKDLEARSARIVDAIERGIATPAMERRLVEIEKRRGELQRAGGAPRLAPVIEIRTDLREIFQAMVGRLELELDEPEERAEAVQVVRHTIDRVVMHPKDYLGNMQIEVTAWPGVALAYAGHNGKNGTVSLVAGEGFVQCRCPPPLKIAA